MQAGGPELSATDQHPSPGPAQQRVMLSLPLDLVCVLSLLHRAVPESHFDPWLIETRAQLSSQLRDNLDLLHGFSGRLLYYMEEPALAFRPLDPDREHATFEAFIAFLLTLPAGSYLDMVERSIIRVHEDLGLHVPPIDRTSVVDWKLALEPCLTTASIDQVLQLIAEPAKLKRMTIDVFVGVWEEGYGKEYAEILPVLKDSVRVGQRDAQRDFRSAVTILTGQKPPGILLRRLHEFQRVVFCPSDYLGSDFSYIIAGSDLIIDFGAPEYLVRASAGAAATEPPASGGPLSEGFLLEVFRALADPTRLKILSYLSGGERYAQEIVSHVAIAQSAVSRHLSQMERSGLITVSPRRGQKFYAVNPELLDAVAQTIKNRADEVRESPGASKS